MGVRTVLSVAVVLAGSLSGCMAFDNGCPDGMWGAQEIDGTAEQVAENRWTVTGVTLCGYQFSVHSGEAVLRLEEISEDARGPLRWGDVRFEVNVEGVMMTIDGATSPMQAHRAEAPDMERETELVVGDEIRFCRSLPVDEHVHVELTQTRYTAKIHDREGTEASFEPMPPCDGEGKVAGVAGP